jgi:hypothetical protein
MAKLSDTQSILLSTASQRENGSLLPLPASIKPSGGTAKAMSALLKRGLTEERETSDADTVHRTNGDVRYGVFLTAAGAGAIGVEPGGSANAAVGDAAVSGSATSAPPTTAVPASKRPTKAAAVVALMARPGGASLPELIEVTGWLPHTTRAALTGLRKKGRDIVRSKRDGATCYRIAEQA